MNELVKFSGGNLPASQEDLVKGLQNVTAHIGPSAGGTPFLRLLQDGMWVYGQENIDVEEGSLWAINPYSIQHGFACWIDSELVGEAMTPFNQAPPKKSDLQDFGEPWKPQTSMLMQCISGEDKGQTVLYKGTSIGMQNAVKELINALINQIQTDPANLVPVVNLESDSYHHKKHGKTYTPILEIDHWISMETGEAAEADEGDEEESADTEVAAEPEAKADGDKPTRRRRGKGGDDKKADDGDTRSPSRRRRRR